MIQELPTLTATEISVYYKAWEMDDSEEEEESEEDVTEEDKLGVVMFPSRRLVEWEREGSPQGPPGYILNTKEVVEFLQSQAGLRLDLAAKFKKRDPKTGASSLPYQ